MVSILRQNFAHLSRGRLLGQGTPPLSSTKIDAAQSAQGCRGLTVAGARRAQPIKFHADDHFSPSRNSFLVLALIGFAAALTAGCGGSASKSLSGAPFSSNGITVAAPANGAAVGSPFNLAASATDCSSAPVTSIGYSLDDSFNTTAVIGASISTQVPAQPGTHLLHVKAWNNLGASCVADVTVAVTDASSPSNPLIPANAVSVNAIQTSNAWLENHDPATGGSSSGAMSAVSSPSLSGNARQFVTNFSNFGGEIYDVTFGNDPNATHFFYDGWVYLTNSTGNMANLEIDMNQVLANGQTVIYGFQCDGTSNTWDYTANNGTPSKPVDVWVHSNAACNVRNWSKNTWHHVQISYSRDDAGNVTYHSVWLDGAESRIEETVPSSFALGWTPALLTNFQVDGLGSGSNTVYLDNLTISRW
jgi:hypothetical protein